MTQNNAFPLIHFKLNSSSSYDLTPWLRCYLLLFTNVKLLIFLLWLINPLLGDTFRLCIYPTYYIFIHKFCHSLMPACNNYCFSFVNEQFSTSIIPATFINWNSTIRKNCPPFTYIVNYLCKYELTSISFIACIIIFYYYLFFLILSQIWLLGDTLSWLYIRVLNLR